MPGQQTRLESRFNRRQENFLITKKSITGISAVGSAGGLGAILCLSMMETAKARNPLQHGHLRDFSRQQNRAKNRFDHINDHIQEKTLNRMRFML